MQRSGSRGPDARFPVLYMHDGQNLFEDADAAFGVAWEVDDVLDALTAAGIVAPHIVVGVDNTPERIADYTPIATAAYPDAGHADAYVDWLVGTVKPTVDQAFRTRCEREATALAGSSLGGLVSLYAFLRHPGIFGRVGALPGDTSSRGDRRGRLEGHGRGA